MPLITPKVGIILIALVLIFMAGIHVGGLRPKARLIALQTAQAQAITQAVLAEQAHAQTESERLRKIIYGYENRVPDPITVGLGHRVYINACKASPLPKAASDPGRVSAPVSIPSGDPPIVGRLQAVIDACTLDASQLDALIAAWPQ